MVADARARRADPTGLGSVRRRYEREMMRRFRALKAVIREAVVKLDVLGLKSPNVNSALMTSAFGRDGSVVLDALVAPAAGQFRFERSASKVNSFMDWLRQAQREGILEISYGTPVTQAANAAWQNVYLESAYQKGIRDAYARAGQQVVGGFLQPVHADAAALVYTRTYEALAGVTEVMATQMSRVLAQGLVEGRGPVDIARSLENVVENVGEVRARMIARTELTGAYAEATLNSYEEMGMEEVEVEAEFSTAGDDSVCPECEDLEGKVFSISESRGVIPVHPNCRCAFIPVVLDPKESQ